MLLVTQIPGQGLKKIIVLTKVSIMNYAINNAKP